MIKYFYKTTVPLASILLLITSLLIAGCGSPSAAADPGLIQIQSSKPVILDVDMAHEDMVSELFLLSHPNVDLRAITISGTGRSKSWLCNRRIPWIAGHTVSVPGFPRIWGL